VIGEKMEEVYKYKDYEEYKKVQIETNVKKEDKVYAKSPVIKKISEELITRVEDEGIKGLCHGVRNGAEIIMFKKYLDKHYNPCDIIGTEISHTSKKYDGIVEMDFHTVKEEYKEQFDFIYSNSLDHSYDPKKALSVWMGQLKENGVLIIEWSKNNFKNSQSDPFSANYEDIKNILWDYGMVEVVNVYVFRLMRWKFPIMRRKLFFVYNYPFCSGVKK
jgi:hypothetical protein